MLNNGYFFDIQTTIVNYVLYLGQSKLLQIACALNY